MEETGNQPPRVAERRGAPETPVWVGPRPRPKAPSSRGGPFLRLLFFYAILIAVGGVLVYFVPMIREAWVSAPGKAVPGVLEQLSGKGEAIALTAQQRDPVQRALTLFFIAVGALAVSIPVAWVYTFTRRLRYDPSLVHSVIVLPLVVSGMVVIVKDSVPLAFSLAGIVAVVRFRNTLKDPKDAVYIFLVLGIGLAAGIQALDIALVMSLVFNATILVLWRFNLGSIYGESNRDLLSIGDRSLMIARTASQREALRWRVSAEAPDMETDGILVVHTRDPDAAKQGVELTLTGVAEDWRVTDKFRTRNGTATFAVLLQLKDKKGDPLKLLEELEERWAQDVEAAEYVTFKKAAQKSE
jgi:hypothetical protein